MDDFRDSQGYQSSSSQGQITNIATKILIPLGSVFIGVIGILTSTTELPVWVYWIMAIYLAIVLLIVFALPTKKFISKTINWFSRRKFAIKKRLELQEFANELNELLGSDRLNTIPSFITQLSSKLSNEVNVLSCLDRNRQQFTILQSWAWALSDNLKYDNHTLFLRDANQFSKLVKWFSWACLWVQQFLNSNVVQEKVTKEIVSDWNVSVQNLTNFTSRVQRIMKSVNNKYNTSLCIEYFEDVKPL